MKTLSCQYLHHAVYFAPDVLRHCCKRFFVDGKMKGDVEMFPVNSTKDISAEKILQAKKDLHAAINKGQETPCTGCPFLTREEWADFDKLNIDHISIESHSVCNMKCSYCSDTYYGGLKPNYDLKELYEQLCSEGVVNSGNLSIAWGGGEPLLLDDFEDIFSLYMQGFSPKYTKIFSNATKFSEKVANYLKSGQLNITTSIDAGCSETFEAVRGFRAFERVFKNLKRYYDFAGRGVIIKYIFTDQNYELSEINGFFDKVISHGLIHCDFQISSDFKCEDLKTDQVASIFKLYLRLFNAGASTVHLDDHLRPRLNRKVRQILESDDIYAKSNIDFLVEYVAPLDKPVILWGAGEYARSLTNDSLFFENNEISFLVDKSKEKQGTKFIGYSVYSPNSVLDTEDFIVIASSMYFNEIYDELIAMGVSKSRIINKLII
ncbi:radical SAM protein [Pseudoalteromonas sp. SS15]|uniref:radical SAM protein n=1 Tax=Pseudoalteromonas sp. SS15 TaxID=3139393 RepID=UPI003BACF977